MSSGKKSDSSGKYDYDYLIVGAGLFGAVFCHEAVKRGKKCLVIDKRHHIGGNCYTEEKLGITVHKYGPHIFHTGRKDIWEYINQFDEFQAYQNEPIAYNGGKVYNLPFNMNTFAQIYGCTNPDEAKRFIDSDKTFDGVPTNLEEKAISMVGEKIYTLLVKGYTEKQWGDKCKNLPPEIIARLPLRFTFDNNYFDDEYQGIPQNGYTHIFEKMLDGADLLLDTKFFPELEALAEKVIYTGKIDEYYGYCYGRLPYRSLRFDEYSHSCVNSFQGAAVINCTDAHVPYTRIVEHKFFYRSARNKSGTVVTVEYPEIHSDSNEPYYPIPLKENNALYERYRALTAKNDKVIFGGRTGDYKYYDMDDTIAKALELAAELLGG